MTLLKHPSRVPEYRMVSSRFTAHGVWSTLHAIVSLFSSACDNVEGICSHLAWSVQESLLT